MLFQEKIDTLNYIDILFDSNDISIIKMIHFEELCGYIDAKDYASLDDLLNICRANYNNDDNLLKLIIYCVEIDDLKSFLYLINGCNMSEYFIQHMCENTKSQINMDNIIDFIRKHKIKLPLSDLKHDDYIVFWEICEANNLNIDYLEQLKENIYIDLYISDPQKLDFILGKINEAGIDFDKFHSILVDYFSPTDIKINQILISYGVDVNSNEKSHFYEACEREEYDIIKLFLDNGLKVDEIDVNNFEFRKFLSYFNIRIIELLISYGFDINRIYDVQFEKHQNEKASTILNFLDGYGLDYYILIKLLCLRSDNLMSHYF